MGRRALAGVLAGALVSAVMVLVPARPAEAAVCEPASQAAWTHCVAGSDGTMILELVSYLGPRGSVEGIVCRPLTAGPHPVLVMNHGAGKSVRDQTKLDPTIDDECASRAREGWVVLASEYRVPSPSSPNSDLCDGEVGDVVAMIDAARGLPFVDDTQIAMRGLSLGGCVTLQIHQAGLSGLVAAASINGPTDMVETYHHSRKQYNQNLCALYPTNPLVPWCPQWALLRDWILLATGGAPGPATQAAYDVRSPLVEAAATATSPVPLALIQGKKDELITPKQTCAFALAVNQQPSPGWDFAPVRYGEAADGWPLSGAAPGNCSGLGTWPSSGDPYPAFPGDHYLLVLNDFAHGSPDVELDRAVELADSFLLAKT